MKKSLEESKMVLWPSFKAEYTVLAGFVVVVKILLGVANSTGGANQSPLIALSFIVGAFASGLAGWVGMQVATQANVRTTAAAADKGIVKGILTLPLVVVPLRV